MPLRVPLGIDDFRAIREQGLEYVEGLAQIRAKGYAAELRATGASEVHAFAVAFDGKRVWVKAGEAEARKKARRKR
jgi:hypothetical protein